MKKFLLNFLIYGSIFLMLFFMALAFEGNLSAIIIEAAAGLVAYVAAKIKEGK